MSPLVLLMLGMDVSIDNLNKIILYAEDVYEENKLLRVAKLVCSLCVPTNEVRTLGCVSSCFPLKDIS